MSWAQQEWSSPVVAYVPCSSGCSGGLDDLACLTHMSGGCCRVWAGPVSPKCYSGLHHMASGFQKHKEERIPNVQVSAFQISGCGTTANVPLPNASHMVSLSLSGGEDYTRERIQGGR